VNPQRIYLDYNAATPIDPRVYDAYMVARKEVWGNASSIHREGQASKALLAQARQRIARRFSVPPSQIVFFSTATEALTSLIRGLIASKRKGRILTSVAEHAAVWQLCQTLSKEGTDVEFMKVGAYGAVCPEALEAALNDQITGIALMSVNNETGVCTDIKRIAALAAERKIPLLVDGVAQLGKAAFHMEEGISAACFSSYKMYAPCGVGFAVLNRGVTFMPLIEGGGQESGRRGGSENVPAIHACSIALEYAFDEMAESSARISNLRDLFEHRILSSLPGVHINGEGPRICNCSNLTFEGVDGEGLLIQLDLAGIAASHGAACASGSMEASRVILEMGYSLERAQSSLRFSLGTPTTEAEVVRAAEIIAACVRKQRGS
jgi:cysteine desulfurase